MIRKAEIAARAAHVGQVDKSGVDYAEHLLGEREAWDNTLLDGLEEA